MQQPSATPHRPVTSLVTGHFRQKSGYLAWRPEGTPDWLLIHTLSGKGRFGYPGGDHIVMPGETVLIRPGTAHDYGVESSLQRWELLWSHFVPRPHWVEWLNWPQVHEGIMHLKLPSADCRKLVQCFRRAHHYASMSQQHRPTFAMHALEEVLLICNRCNPRSLQVRFDVRVRDAMDFISSQLALPITLTDIAEASGLSVSRLASLFRNSVGMSPMQYLEAQRIDRAISLLKLTSMSVKEIAQRVGFASQFYFSIRFKRATRLSPRAFRDDPG